jgi:hypothetical protein
MGRDDPAARALQEWLRRVGGAGALAVKLRSHPSHYHVSACGGKSGWGGMIPLRGLCKDGFAGKDALARWQSNCVLIPHTIMCPPAAENPDGEG